MVRESVSKVKNKKAAGPPGVVSEMIKAGVEAGVDLITDLVNQIIVELVIPAEWELSTIVNFYKRNCDSLERGNYGRLKLTDQILKILESVSEKLIRQQVNIDEIQSGFMSRYGNATNAIYILRQLQEKYLAK